MFYFFLTHKFCQQKPPEEKLRPFTKVITQVSYREHGNTEAWVWSPERSGGNLEAKFTEFSIAQ